MKKVLILMSLLLVVACGKKEEEKVVKEEAVVEEQIVVKEVEKNEEEVMGEEEVEEAVLEDEIVVEEEKMIEIDRIVNANLRRYQLTNEINEREPQGEVREFSLNTRAFMFNEWTDIGEEKAVIHRWYHLGKDDVPELMASVNLSVKGSRWRTWSSKELNRRGTWIVEVEDYNGDIIIKEELIVN